MTHNVRRNLAAIAAQCYVSAYAAGDQDDRGAFVHGPRLRNNWGGRLIETVPDAMVIADAKGSIVLVNTQAELLFGYDAQELLGQSVEILVPESLRRRHTQHRDEFRAEPRTRPMGSGLELFGRRKDGSVFPIEISLSPAEDSDGFFVTASVRDISERQKAQEALRQSEERFRLLVAEVKDYAIFMLDPTGRVQTWNEGAEKIKGYRAEEIVGQHFSRFYTPEDIERGKPEESLKIAASQERWEDESWRVRKDGSKFWASVVITALRDQQGKAHWFYQGNQRHHRTETRARSVSPGDYQRPCFQPEHSPVTRGYLFLPAPDQEVRFRVHRPVRPRSENAKDRGSRRCDSGRVSGGRVDLAHRRFSRRMGLQHAPPAAPGGRAP